MDTMPSTPVPAPGQHVIISRIGFDTVQRVLQASKTAVFCTGGWRLTPTPKGWRWDVDTDDRNPTMMRPAPHLDEREQTPE